MTALLMIPCNFITPTIIRNPGRTFAVHVNTVNKIILALLCLGLAGCSSLPGSVTQTTAKRTSARPGFRKALSMIAGQPVASK